LYSSNNSFISVFSFGLLIYVVVSVYLCVVTTYCRRYLLYLTCTKSISCIDEVISSFIVAFSLYYKKRDHVVRGYLISSQSLLQIAIDVCTVPYGTVLIFFVRFYTFIPLPLGCRNSSYHHRHCVYYLVWVCPIILC
jgi:hypothetical protein